MMDFVSGLPLTPTKKVQFRSRFLFYISILEKVSRSTGTRLDFSTAFHPQTNGQPERVIQILEDILRGCIIEFQGS
ncbi:DNA/RNA polymerase superfamily protein [Gossypium australe]|uniref:DNA/RNA polymerase superfamily protein n=1 Tax=Gossypium australe TaxID=47621 RepID=A0A5B6W0K2_9ROSI|nr:DNA/RNA polymerase superfamily protein [Gossypium australe]